MSPEEMLHQLQPQSQVSIRPHQSHGRKCLKKTQNIANATCPVEDSERVHQNIDLHDFTHLFDILKGDLKSMQIEVGQRFIHATENFFFLHNLSIKDN